MISPVELHIVSLKPSIPLLANAVSVSVNLLVSVIDTDVSAIASIKPTESTIDDIRSVLTFLTLSEKSLIPSPRSAISSPRSPRSLLPLPVILSQKPSLSPSPFSIALSMPAAVVAYVTAPVLMPDMVSPNLTRLVAKDSNRPPKSSRSSSPTQACTTPS